MPKILFCLFLITSPILCYAQSGQEISADIKNIRIISESGNEILVSPQDIKDYLLKGLPVHFVNPGQEEEKRKIEPDWIIDALNQGVEKIDIENAIVTGDLDIRKGARPCPVEESGLEQEMNARLESLGIKKVFLISSFIKIENSRLEGKFLAGIDWERRVGVVFQRDIHFSCTFQDKVDFERATFQHWADFRSAIFEGEANFSLTTFKDMAYICVVVFKNTVAFVGAIFKDSSSFSFTNFKDVNFNGAEFHDSVDFIRTDFEGTVSFENTEFQDEVDFREASFQNNADFMGCNFQGSLTFTMLPSEAKQFFMELISSEIM